MRTRVAAGIALVFFIAGTLLSRFDIRLVDASGIVYIRADGSIDPPSAPIFTGDNVTYTLIGDVSAGIVVERNDVIVDGVGYTVQGSGSGGVGFDLTGRENVSVQNVTIRSFGGSAIMLNSSFGNTISGNFINTGYGVRLVSSSNNTVSGNFFFWGGDRNLACFFFEQYHFREHVGRLSEGDIC